MSTQEPVAYGAFVRLPNGEIRYTLFKTRVEADAATEKFEAEHQEIHRDALQRLQS